MTEKTVLDKLYVKNAATIAIMHAGPENAPLTALLPPAKLVATGAADLVLLFARSQAELEARLPVAKARLTPRGALWVAYVKGTSTQRGDLHRDTIRTFAGTIGLDSVAMIAIDEHWSALRLKAV